jgi:hypothetical protein
VYLLPALPNALQNVCGKVIILHFIQATLDEFPEVKCFTAASLRGQELQTSFDIFGKSD